ncbi:MAG: S8 family serine peptidase, partial [Bacteroidota bacterium]
MLRFRFWSVALAAVLIGASAAAQSTLSLGDVSGRLDALHQSDKSAGIAPPAALLALDPAARALALAVEDHAKAGTLAPWWQRDVAFEGLAASQKAGEIEADLFVQTDNVRSLSRVPGLEVLAFAGDVAAVRVTGAGLRALTSRPDLRFIEAARTRPTLNLNGRVDIRADEVHAGSNGLPQAYRGEDVVVGVLDSGLDLLHPDFSDGGGTRVQALLEFLNGGATRQFTKAQIDANPGAIPQYDGNGHGTHVAGTAAGGGRVEPLLRGIAPASDLVFVNGTRDPDGNSGFFDADVVAGAQFVFQQAQALGKPAVLNLSLGGNSGPLDGSSLYEQALSNLTGPGRIIVAAAGNSGFDFIHAGAQTQANVQTETLILPDNPGGFGTELWYDAGTRNQFAIAAYSLDGSGNLTFIGLTSVNAGQILADGAGQPVPFEVNGQLLGFVRLDAATTQDPRNGDGNAVLQVVAPNGGDLRQFVWSVITAGPASGRLDAWAFGGEFYNQTVGFQGIQEIPGDVKMTMGSPSTAREVIAVGSYTTTNAWTDIDGQSQQWLNPNPSGNSNDPPVLPAFGSDSYFSSHGPTRDGRVTPDISAPGELVFSTLSSRVQIGTPVNPRRMVLPGGMYQGLQGTSMASPHVAGVVALMLQVDPSLTPTEVRQILQQTARSDAHTGGLPNNHFGAGKTDALAAVLRTIQLCGDSCSGSGSGTSVAEAEPNNETSAPQVLTGAGPITVSGSAESTDAGGLDINYNDGSSDDVEDLYRITTTTSGLTITLDGFNRDLDLFLLDDPVTQIIESSNEPGETLAESINASSLPPGTYLVGVSFYDAGPESGSTGYTLTVSGSVATNAEGDPEAEALALLPVRPNPV